MTPEPSSENVATWSADGQWLYFLSDREGSWQIWRIPDGGGPAAQVTRGGGFYPVVSRDGRDLYYTKLSPRPTLWRVPVEGGDEIEVVSEPLNERQGVALSATGIYYSTSRKLVHSEEYTIHFLDFETGQVTELFQKEGARPRATRGFT
jgi:Tol biopolymer transport system component